MSLKSFTLKSYPFFLLAALWLWCFRGFLTGEIIYRSDAAAYMEHFRFFIDHLKQGIFPLWEPGRNDGVPIEFFLRRIGSFNPFHSVLLLLSFLPWHFRDAYTAFLVIYYFFGLSGFYLLIKDILQEKQAAFLALMLLAFSSLSTRLFDSYFLLVCIPLVWSFYFLRRFSRKQDIFSFFSFILMLMILLTTYVPFYFINIFMTFAVIYVIFYFQNTKQFISQTTSFIKSHPFVAVGGVLLIGIALVPGYLFYLDGAQGEISLPKRSAASSQVNALSVGMETIASWGMIEDIMYSLAFDDVRRFGFAIVYIPLWGFVVLALSMINRLNRLSAFILTWMVVVFFLSLEHAPIYHWFHQHVFYFKYFRNLHFFLWMILIPLLCFLIGSEWVKLKSLVNRSNPARWFVMFFIVCIHLLMIIIINMRSYGSFSSYFVVGASFLFFLILNYIVKRESRRNLFYVFTILLIGAQSLEVYHYLHRNHETSGDIFYRYDIGYTVAELPNQNTIEKHQLLAQLKLHPNYIWPEKNFKEIYFSTPWYAYLLKTIDATTLISYSSLKFIVYDQIKKVDVKDMPFKKIEEHLLSLNNMAWVPKDYDGPKKLDDSNYNSKAVVVEDKGELLEIVSFNANHMTLVSRFKKDKFLVYNDNYHTRWKAKIDGHKVPIYRANVAFKGLWIPAGEHTVHMYFESTWRHVMNWLYLIIFYIIGWGCVFGYIKQTRGKMRE